ncbi:MAG: cupin domain-containing protein [Caldilineaceae bacterium]|nr:cupin domain-containing protein [Caldilineaceae bacterium]MCY4093327.1 cupin domain-containing protein [Caldilineaceae bacterium]MCY4115983.1 cupin domain-containing protein [Caldilineaceae bacterium]MDE0430918.1 cupin domain-containing protein [Caldilineaceae bacterium]
MIIKGSAIPEVNFRKGYEIGDAQEQIDHFAMRITTPVNPFEPEKHGEQRFWYILEGEATVTIDGECTAVGPSDLILIAPWTDHSLRADNWVRWICFG